MIISSEITGKTYKTVYECLADEKEFIRKEEEAKAAKEAHEKELNDAYEEAIAACERYLKLTGVDVDINDNGYKITIDRDTEDGHIFEEVVNLLFD